MIDLAVVSADYQRRLSHRNASALPQVWALLDQVTDPEIPVLSLWDLGVLTDIRQIGNRLVVTITPTYSGCPALETMRDDIVERLRQAGIEEVDIRERLAPAWSSDWISPAGHRKLIDYGIAAPKSCASCRGSSLDAKIQCPHCNSSNTRMTSEFGSTACKALFQCQACHEPFDYFKPI